MWPKSEEWHDGYDEGYDDGYDEGNTNGYNERDTEAKKQIADLEKRIEDLKNTPLFERKEND